MNENNTHPLTEARVKKLWEAYRERLKFSNTAPMDILRAAYDAGREDALKPLDPLADLTPGTTIRDVDIKGHGAVGDAFISTDIDGPCVATAYDWYPLDAITEFTTDDRTTRYSLHGDTWTAENLDGDA